MYMYINNNIYISYRNILKSIAPRFAIFDFGEFFERIEKVF